MAASTVYERRKEIWLEDQNDPDNWVRIPEFGVLPMANAFNGFAFPIVHPNSPDYAFMVLVRVAVKTMRELVQLDLKSLIEVREQWLEVLDLLDIHGFEGPPISVSHSQRAAAMYSIGMTSIETLHRRDEESIENRLLLLADISDHIGKWAIQRNHAANEATISFSMQQKNMLSKAGLLGAKVKNALSNELKDWALGEAVHMKGLPAEKARKLMEKIPSPLLQRLKEDDCKLKDPERVIRDALAYQRKKLRQASQP